MCHYVTATVPREIAPEILAPIFAAHGLQLRALANPHVVAQLPAGDRYLLTTGAQCDCGTPLGSARATAEQRQLQKLRKKKWSEAKIRRWLEQKHRTRTAELDRWLAFLGAALACAPRIGLLLHWYRGDVDSEPIELTRVEVPRAQLTAGLLLSMQEDVVYELLA